MSWHAILLAILGLALLMVVHESGHYFIARAFGLRVLRFSIGFGPPLWRHTSKKNGTVFQLALIPFIAYVQVAGMNPFEETDPSDEGSYSNASLPARISTIVAGPLANYLFASVLFFGAFVLGGQQVYTSAVKVVAGGAAEDAQMKDGDEIVRIADKPIEDFEQMREIILANPGRELDVKVLRDGSEVVLKVTPKPNAGNGGGLIGVSPIATRRVSVSLQDASVMSITEPAAVVYQFVAQLGRIITGQDRPDLSGPVGISRKIGEAYSQGLGAYLYILGVLSAYLGGFNLLPVPALDGGRLLFLVYEGVARRKPNARIEAHIHAIGLLMFLALMVVVSVFDIRRE
jgi:regulator of sigma E protease